MSAVSGTYAFIPQQHAYVPQIGRYNLDELIGGEGLFFQDSYRMRPNFTINYGLRWDFTSEDKDLSNLYHSAVRQLSRTLGDRKSFQSWGFHE